MLTIGNLQSCRLRGASAPQAGTLDLPALVGAAAWSRLPAAVQRRFSVAHDDVTYEGQMDLRCSLIGHIFALLARPLGGPLTRLNACAVPTKVRVFSNAHGGVVWERAFHAGRPGLTCIVRSTKEVGLDGSLLERTEGGLSMSLDVFEEHSALVFRSRRFGLVLGLGRLGVLRLPVPTILTPGTCRVKHTDLGEGRFLFTLRMVHPLWGETFHQSGVFVDPARLTDESTQ